MKKRCFSIVLCLLLLLALPLSASAAWPYVVDDAGLLGESQRNDLLESCIFFHDETGMEIAVVTVNSLDGKSAMAYADDYYEAHYGPNGLMLLISMGEREWHITTSGSAISAFSDADLMDMENGLMKYLPDGRYYDAFDQFVYDAIYFAEHDYEDAEVSDFTVCLIMALPVGAVIAGIVLLIMRGAMNSKTAKYSAEDYMDRGSYRLTRNQDLFLYSNISKTPRPQQTSSSSSSSSGSSGGSSVHRSSSGTSHGGRGGKF